jgi:hypothetical protein
MSFGQSTTKRSSSKTPKKIVAKILLRLAEKENAARESGVHIL